jgi:hypothetical protein
LLCWEEETLIQNLCKEAKTSIDLPLIKKCNTRLEKMQLFFTNGADRSDSLCLKLDTVSAKSVDGRVVVRFLRENKKEDIQYYGNSIKTSELIWICSLGWKMSGFLSMRRYSGLVGLRMTVITHTDRTAHG